MYLALKLTTVAGQRYNIIVEANPNVTQASGNYWIRTVPVVCGLSRFNTTVDERTGIVRYNPWSQDDPTTSTWDFSRDCSDETYTSLKPVVPWTVHWNATRE